MIATPLIEQRRPVLRYFGSKWRLAPWIISHFPKHHGYVEPFGGGCNLLLRKPPSKVEVYNDLDGDVVNFFRVLREKMPELLRAIELTPYSRQEMLAARDGREEEKLLSDISGPGRCTADPACSGNPAGASLAAGPGRPPWPTIGTTPPTSVIIYLTHHAPMVL